MTETAKRAARVTVRVLAFARLRELLAFGEQLVSVPDGSTLDDLWMQLASRTPTLASLRASTRFARNAELVGDTGTVVRDGDEIALLPPVGGG